MRAEPVTRNFHLQDLPIAHLCSEEIKDRIGPPPGIQLPFKCPRNRMSPGLAVFPFWDALISRSRELFPGSQHPQPLPAKLTVPVQGDQDVELASARDS